MKRESSREKYPLLFAFGDRHEFLSPEAAREAPFEARVRSIWPFLVRRVKGFQETLTYRERANFDVEDTLSEMYITLSEKDGSWRPDDGRYITFAGVIVERELCSIRDRSRTVQSPRNSTGRLKEYQAEEDQGTISARRLQTFNDIRRTSAGVIPAAGSHRQGIDLEDSRRDDADGSATKQKAACDAVMSAVRRVLTAQESAVLSRLAGLWGQERQSVWGVAFTLGLDELDVRSIRQSAITKIRKNLPNIGYVAAGEDEEGD